MATLSTVIYKRLTSDDAINAACKGNVSPQFRDDTTPAIAYDIRIEDTYREYEGLAAIDYEVTISVMDTSYDSAVALANLVVGNIDNATWTDETYTVVAAFLRDRDEALPEEGNKDNRVAQIDLRFDWIVRQSPS